MSTLQVGDSIARREFAPITRHTLALYCGASGDHNPIHVDIDFARASGFDDVFAHGMLAMAYLGQTVTDAIPPDRLRFYSARFAAITQVGAVLTCTGTVAEILDVGGEKRARLELKAEDQNGEIKLIGEAQIAL